MTDELNQHADSFSSDPLLKALLLLARWHGRQLSASAAVAGLPLKEDGQLPLELFPRAAQRAKLHAQWHQQSFAQAMKQGFPQVLLLDDGQPVVIAAHIAEDRAYRLLEFDAEGEMQEILIPAKQLAQRYAGQGFFIQARYPFEARSQKFQPQRPRHWYWQTVWQARGLYAEVLLASLLINLFALATPLFVMNVYDRVIPNQAMETLWVLASGVAIVIGFDFLLRSLRGYFIDTAGKRADLQLSALIHAQVLNTQLKAQPRSAGAFANQMQEFDAFRDFFTSATLTTVIDLPFTVLFLLLIWFLGGDLVWVPLLAMPVVLTAGILLQFPLRKVIADSLQAGAQKNAMLVETLSHLETVKALGAESQQQRRWELLNQEIARHNLRARWLSSFSVHFSLLVQQSSYLAVIIFGVYLIRAGELSMGGLIACSILGARALAPLAQIAGLLTRYQHAVSALHGLDHIMSQPVEHETNTSLLSRPKLRGEIELRQVCFQYPEQQTRVLNDLSLHIQAGERVAIIGRVGSGKSTIARLLLGLYPPDMGGVLVDGLDNRQLEPADVRRNIGYVPQEPDLFYGSVRDNIAFGVPHSDDEAVLRAARIAGVEDWLKQHPQGFALPVGERGGNLSGGQRQAIAIARALLQDPPVLLFDEPSNAMDNRSEELFKQRLEAALTPQHTLLLITHRASLLSLVNRLIIMDAGRVIADGPKEQVLADLAAGNIRLET